MYKKALVAVSQFAFLVAGNPVPSSTSQEASSAASTPSTASATASSTSAEFHTQPALRGSNFDYGTSSPQSVLQTLSQHCGALNCDPSWTVPYQYIKSSSLVSGTLKVTVTDADWDGAAIGKNMNGGIVSLGGVGVNKTSSSYYDYSNGGVDGQEKKVDTYKGFSELALGRFDSNSDQAGTITVSISSSSDCTSVDGYVKGAFNSLGAVNTGASMVAPFFGTILDLICAING